MVDEIIRRAPYGASPEVGTAGSLTRARLLDAARELLAEKPFESISADEIADRAGRSRTALYQYFENTGQILMVLSSRVMRDLDAAGATFAERLREAGGRAPAVRGWVGDIGTVYAAHSMVFGAWMPGRPAVDEAHQLAHAAMLGHAERAAAALSRAGAQLIDPTLAALSVVMTIIRAWHHFQTGDLAMPAAVFTDELAATIERMLFGSELR
jgi:AcrR family transcriptional regulator